MTIRQLSHFALISLGALALWAPAHAQAPITYAGQNDGEAVQMASVGAGLAGGGDNSYGYGAVAPAAQGAAIDIRRNRAGAAAERPAPPAEQASARPGWLEQERVGPPYEANGRWYVPTPEPGYSETGIASWYGPTFHGQATASGEAFDQEALTAAHPTLPIPSLVQVTNLENGREIIVRVNDRGPFVGERLIDLSRRSAEVLGFERQGQARVHVRYLGPAPRRVAADAAQTAPQAPQARREAEEGPMSLLPASAAYADAPAGESRTLGAPLGEPQRFVPRAAPAAGGFVVQVGAFSDLGNVHRVREQAAAAGPVEVDVRTTASGAELFRVRVGPWGSREQAEAARAQLAALGFAESVVAAR